MVIRVTRGRFSPANEAAMMRALQEQVLPNVRQLPGFKSFHIGVDREAGRVVAVSVFDTREQSEAVAAQRAPGEAVGIQFEPAEVYEVIGQA